MSFDRLQREILAEMGYTVYRVQPAGAGQAHGQRDGDHGHDEPRREVAQNEQRPVGPA